MARILLVEDNEDDRALFRMVLSRHGVEVDLVEARDGVEALEILAKDPLPALVLLDLHMPRLDGFAVLKKIRADERLAGLNVMILTSSDENADMRRARARGANGFLSKPTGFGGWDEVIVRIARNCGD
ncbi:MAG: response regulator [Proteobacteria bacterium]|nr:response regulator [Pseudomonadota bacterium]MCP4918460.1 response regulator [Pseudomonadota bacterium]